uniref:ABC transporter permease n=1 Tax=Streptomyces sp. NBC_00148 TaxID=2903626 RepID=A0AAU1M436_9ACTN
MVNMTTTQLDTVLSSPPRWAVAAAHAAALVTLPSGVWRLLLAAGFTAGYTEAGYEAMGFTGWGGVYVVGLSLGGELLALLTLGLVRPWGEVLPRWIPLVGGRRPNPRAKTVAASLGAAVLTLLLAQFAFWWAFPHPDMTPLGSTIAGILYLPLVAWGPLLAAVTLDHHRRRRAAGL